MTFKYLLLFIILNIPFFGISQSYVFCPKGEIENQIDIEGNVFFVFRDSRTYEQKLKEKCTKEEVFAAVTNYINSTFPNVKTTVLEENQYTEQPISDQITFKIDLKKYDATFYTGVYVSYTKLLVKIYDYRKGSEIFEFEINGKGSQFNTLGYSSGKKASTKSFNRAMNEFNLVIEKVIEGNMEQQKETVAQSKVDRLRELKELLDEGILTQEEFNSEKKKVLDNDL